eukprot:491325-Pleurochrysis_carterae.AAC.1
MRTRCAGLALRRPHRGDAALVPRRRGRLPRLVSKLAVATECASLSRPRGGASGCGRRLQQRRPAFRRASAAGRIAVEQPLRLDRRAADMPALEPGEPQRRHAT